eukprot:5660-Pyramimonas_sp.AAC.1
MIYAVMLSGRRALDECENGYGEELVPVLGCEPTAPRASPTRMESSAEEDNIHETESEAGMTPRSPDFWVDDQ